LSKILIIGSSGFIGKPLLNAIKKYDVQVIGAGRQKFTYDGNIYKVDIFQPESYISGILK
jgi:nucleoside-diphosphate-sugar epimerase